MEAHPNLLSRNRQNDAVKGLILLSITVSDLKHFSNNFPYSHIQGITLWVAFTHFLGKLVALLPSRRMRRIQVSSMVNRGSHKVPESYSGILIWKTSNSIANLDGKRIFEKPTPVFALFLHIRRLKLIDMVAREKD